MEQHRAAGNASFLKKLNQYRILNALRYHSSLSRTELARLTALTPMAVGTLVKDLLDEGFLMEEACQCEGASGRPPVPLALNPRAGIAIGINVGITRIVVLALDVKGQIQARRTLPMDANTSPEAVVQQLAAEVQAIITLLRPKRILGAGVGLHGVVDHENGVLAFAPHFGWREVPFASMLGRALDLPVVADNGVRCQALGELRYGAGREVRNFICVGAGAGIGSAIVLDGRLYHGATGTAGEIGHMTVDLEGPVCHCGNYGCLETIASSQALVRRVVRMIKRGESSAVKDLVPDLAEVTPEVVARAAVAGDAVARHALHEVGNYIGIALANVVKLLNPSLILMGVAPLPATDLLLASVRRTLAERALDPRSAGIPVRPFALGDDAAPVGAACLVLDRFFGSDHLSAAFAE